MATDRQKAHALIIYFRNAYEKKFGGPPPRFNRHSLSYGFEALVKDYPDRAEEIIDYYIDSYSSPDPTNFTYQYGSIVEAIDDEKNDEKVRKELRRRTRERMMNVTNGGQGVESGGSE